MTTLVFFGSDRPLVLLIWDLTGAPIWRM